MFILSILLLLLSAWRYHCPPTNRIKTTPPPESNFLAVALSPDRNALKWLPTI
jgi:hypothetical protein